MIASMLAIVVGNYFFMQALSCLSSWEFLFFVILVVADARTGGGLGPGRGWKGAVLGELCIVLTPLGAHKPRVY